MFIFLAWKRPTRKGRTGFLIMIMFWCYTQEVACSEFYWLLLQDYMNHFSPGLLCHPSILLYTGMQLEISQIKFVPLLTSMVITM